MKNFEDPSSEDLKVIERQLGRPPRNVLKIAHRCECGAPAVITTAPRLSDGTPFPTYFYATCPKLTGALSTLESAGLMTQFNQELSTDSNLREHLKTAHDRYLQARDLAMKNLAETSDDENHELKNISAVFVFVFSFLYVLKEVYVFVFSYDEQYLFFVPCYCFLFPGSYPFSFVFY